MLVCQSVRLVTNGFFPLYIRDQLLQASKKHTNLIKFLNRLTSPLFGRELALPFVLLLLRLHNDFQRWVLRFARRNIMLSAINLFHRSYLTLFQLRPIQPETAKSFPLTAHSMYIPLCAQKGSTQVPPTRINLNISISPSLLAHRLQSDSTNYPFLRFRPLQRFSHRICDHFIGSTVKQLFSSLYVTHMSEGTLHR